MNNSKIYKSFGGLINLKLKKIIFFGIIFVSIFLNPLFLRASNEIKKEGEDTSLSKDLESTSLLQKDLYLLGTGDILGFKVIGLPELTTDISILNDGNATIPLLGITNISGMSINEAVLNLEKLLSKELISPKVELTLKDARPIKISIIGEVLRPGIYKMKMNVTDLPSLINAIEQAGGLTYNADLRNIELKRRLSGNDFKFKKTILNLKDLITKGEQQNNPYLFDGDIIRINKGSKIDKEIMSIASTSLSPKNIRVNFLGEVRKLGPVIIPSNSTLIDGIFAAGGFTDLRANYKFVEILRINRNGRAFKKRYKITLGSNYSEENNPILNNGDSVWVKKNKFANVTDTLKGVSSPIGDVLTIWTFFKLTD